MSDYIEAGSTSQVHSTRQWSVRHVGPGPIQCHLVPEAEEALPDTPLGPHGQVFPRSRPIRSRPLTLGAAVLALVLFVGWHTNGLPHLPISNPISLANDVGLRNASAPCDWTFTVEFSGMRWGLGSTLFLHLLGIDWALLQGRTILFDDDENGLYGSYWSLFQPRDIDLPCRASDDLYEPYSSRVCANLACLNPTGAGYGPVRKNHTAFVGQYLVTWAQEWGLSRFSNEDLLRSPDFPQMDSQTPLPVNHTIPDAFREGYRRINSIWQTYYQPSEPILAMVADRVAQLKPVRDRAPLIALHWRAGDKVRIECFPSARMSCGNVTLHAEAAWNAYTELDLPPSAREQKPTLAIITAEHDAVELFKADPIGSRFEVMRMPTAAGLEAFDQFKFNALTPEARKADMQSFLTNFYYALDHADAFVVSGVSNAGRLALTMAGEEKIDSGFIRSVDVWWHPGAWIVAPPRCMGRTKCGP